MYLNGKKNNDNSNYFVSERHKRRFAMNQPPKDSKCHCCDYCD